MRTCNHKFQELRSYRMVLPQTQFIDRVADIPAVRQRLLPTSIVGAKILQKMWEGRYCEGVWLYLDPWDVVRLRTPSCFWNVPRKYGPYGELFFFLIKKEPFTLTEAVQFQPFVSAETLQGSVVQGILCGKTMCLARQVRLPLAGRCTSTTTSAGLLKSSGGVGQARWWRSFLKDWELGRVA